MLPYYRIYPYSDSRRKTMATEGKVLAHSNEVQEEALTRQQTNMLLSIVLPRQDPHFALEVAQR